MIVRRTSLGAWVPSSWMNHRWHAINERTDRATRSSQYGHKHQNKTLVGIPSFSRLILKAYHPMTLCSPYASIQNIPLILLMLTSHCSQSWFMSLLQGTNILLEDHFLFFHTVLSLGNILSLKSPGMGAKFQCKLWFLQISQFGFQS